MARNFTKSANTYIAFNAGSASALANAPAISGHAWLNLDTTGANANYNSVVIIFINALTVGYRLNIDAGSGGRKIRLSGRSTTADAMQSRVGSDDMIIGQWESIGGVNDYALNRQMVYHAGELEFNTAKSFGSSSYVPGTPTSSDGLSGGSEGNAITAASNYATDGRMAEVAIWAVNIGADNYMRLAQGVPASEIMPEHLVIYLPLLGAGPSAYELDPRSKTGLIATINGTITVADHVPLRRRRLSMPALRPAALVAGYESFLYPWMGGAGAGEVDITPPGLIYALRGR